MINKKSPVPMYVQISEDIKNQIANGELKSNSQLPSERELGQHYGVSRITIRQAIDLLEKNRLVFTVQGKGTFVERPTISQNLMKVTNFQKTLQEKGIKGSTVVLGFERNIQPSMFSKRPAPKIFQSCGLKILGLGDGSPMVYYHSFLRGDVGEEMHPLAQRMSEGGEAFSTFDLYEKIGRPICRMEQQIFAENGQPQICSALRIDPADAVLRLESVIYDQYEQVMEYKIGYYRSDMYSFSILRSVG